MPEPTPVVYVVDDDAGIRDALDSLIRSAGFAVRSYSSAAEFLNAGRSDVPGCLILDVRMPGLSGLDLQSELARIDVDIPIIFVTAHGNIPMSVRAIKAGAVEFLTKPFRDQDLLEAIRLAVERDRAGLSRRIHLRELRRRFQTLTPREREVMELVVTGLLNKQIAARLGTSEVTVKLQRGSVMHKMEAGSVAQLVRMAEKLGTAT
jgi:FixJ family two-component response regulator